MPGAPPQPRNQGRSARPPDAAPPQASPAGGGAAPAGGAGGGGGAFAYNWCNNGGPGGGSGASPQGAGTRPVPPPLNPGRGGIFRSDNKGGNWTQVSGCNPPPMQFSQLRVDPGNTRRCYIAGCRREVARRRPHVRDAHDRRRQQLARTRRPARHLDRSEEPEATDSATTAASTSAGTGQALGLRQHDGDRNGVLGQR